MGTRQVIPTPDFRISPGGRKHIKTKNSLAAGIGGWGKFSAAEPDVRFRPMALSPDARAAGRRADNLGRCPYDTNAAVADNGADADTDTNVNTNDVADNISNTNVDTNTCVYIYIYICIYRYMHICIYIYIERERCVYVYVCRDRAIHMCTCMLV